MGKLSLDKPLQVHVPKQLDNARHSSSRVLFCSLWSAIHDGRFIPCFVIRHVAQKDLSLSELKRYI